MPEESRRTFLMRYAAMALAAVAPKGARAGEDDGGAIKSPADDLMPEKKVVYGPPPTPFPTDRPRRPPRPAPVYGPPPSPYPTLDPQRPLPPVALYGPLPRNPLDP
jgi:hypothetical protein